MGALVSGGAVSPPGSSGGQCLGEVVGVNPPKKKTKAKKENVLCVKH